MLPLCTIMHCINVHFDTVFLFKLLIAVATLKLFNIGMRYQVPIKINFRKKQVSTDMSSKLFSTSVYYHMRYKVVII